MRIYGLISLPHKYCPLFSVQIPLSTMSTATPHSVALRALLGRWCTVRCHHSLSSNLTDNNRPADLTFNYNPLPFGIVTNYYLVDVSPANGGTELWLGSHKNSTFADMRNCTEEIVEDFGIKDECLEERRVYAPPIQAVVKQGSVVLRDLRLWHAGLPNPSNDTRIMLAFVHFPWVSVTSRVLHFCRCKLTGK